MLLRFGMGTILIRRFASEVFLIKVPHLRA